MIEFFYSDPPGIHGEEGDTHHLVWVDDWSIAREGRATFAKGHHLTVDIGEDRRRVRFFFVPHARLRRHWIRNKKNQQPDWIIQTLAGAAGELDMHDGAIRLEPSELVRLDVDDLNLLEAMVARIVERLR